VLFLRNRISILESSLLKMLAMNDQTPIFVTRPWLPPLEDVIPYLQSIWDTRILTNSGPLHNQLESRLAEYLQVPCISLFSNATLALIVAIKALRLTGQVITPSYSFVATSQAIAWNNLTPVFADIRSSDYCLDPKAIIRKITPITSAILAVQCYGNPGPFEEIRKIADDYNLSLIYDAAHSFGAKCDCGSIVSHGDLSVLSFHATKVFNTFEGGAIVCKDVSTKRKIDRLKNFGFVDESNVGASGINAKMSELHAAIGLAQLDYIDDVIQEREYIAVEYSNHLADVKGIEIPGFYQSVERHNYAYYPIRIKFGKRDEVYGRLKRFGIYSRKYFFPLISDFQFFKAFSRLDDDLVVSRKAANEVLCLPIYPGMTKEDVHRIISAIKDCLL
jgi:dTDP-4-amino-4,6-dideoxygalactose transaminase